jgi:hypothetical protein
MMYKIQVHTLHGNILTYSVDSYSITDGDFVTFVDKKTGEKKSFHASNCEIYEVPR